MFRTCSPRNHKTSRTYSRHVLLSECWVLFFCCCYVILMFYYEHNVQGRVIRVIIEWGFMKCTVLFLLLLCDPNVLLRTQCAGQGHPVIIEWGFMKCTVLFLLLLCDPNVLLRTQCPGQSDPSMVQFLQL